MTTITIDTSNAMRVVRGIVPPMKFASIIPVEVEREVGRAKCKFTVIIYVAASPFATPMTEVDFQSAVAEIVDQLEVREG